MRRKIFGIMLAAFALFVGTVGYADDEKIANHLYKKLSEAKQQGSLKNFSLDMEVKDGVVYFSGRVNNKTQKSLVLTMAQKAQDLGVVEIRDGITVKAAQVKPSQVKPVQVKPATSSRVTQASATKPVQDFDYLSGGPQTVAPPTRVAAVPTRPMSAAPMPAQGQALQAPSYMPASAANGARYDSPGLPNYAWPSYAPHPNYGAVTYPKTYSPTAWPYIGPFYPYPQVPLGWRKVTLEWDDGWWYLDFNDR